MTPDQHIASSPKLCVWVSASAGTGKTKVLTDRVLRLLLSGSAPSRILCITYTRAASAEMESRISACLARWVTAEDETLKAELAVLTGDAPSPKQMKNARRLFASVQDAPERIRIQTIHSLCQSILARFPLEAGVPPHFTAIDDMGARALLAQARTELFTRAGDPAYPAIGEALLALGEHMGEAALQALLAQIIAERGKFSGWFEADSALLWKALGLPPELDEEKLKAKHWRYSLPEEQALREACAALALGQGDSDRNTCAALRAWLGSREDVQAYLRAWLTEKNAPRVRLCTKATLKILPAMEATLLAEQQRAVAYLAESQSLFVARMSLHVSAIAGSVLRHYHWLKERHGYLDYDDLIIYTERLLTRTGVTPWVLYKLDEGIDHLLIDEAQDTAPAQWRIVDALAAEFFAGEGARDVERTLFVVGDEKQSIYSFQGADPHAFDAMQRRLSKRATDGGADFRRVRLALSFRSTVPVLEAVDTVFALPEARDGLIFSEGDIRHEAHRLGAAGRVELWPLVEALEEEPLPAWHIPGEFTSHRSPERLCAEAMAEKIESWLKEKRLLLSQNRPVRPGDILILVQRRGYFAGAMLRALKKRGVPVAGADRLTLTEHIAVEDCMALAHFLLLPQDSLTLAAVLRSPFIGLSEEALFTLAHDRGEESLWQRLTHNPAYGQAHAYLADLLARVDYLTPYALFAHVLETCGGRKALAVRLGDEINDPLNEFLALALEYERTRPPSLQGFLHWLAEGEIQIKRDMEKGRDEVRILTVHSAKGLQAPIVFLPDTTRMPRRESGIFWTADEIPVPLFSPLASRDDAHYRALREAKRAESEREYRRLLYVAMTRAEDELYLCGWKSGKAVDEKCWYALMQSAFADWQEEDGKKILHEAQSAPVKAVAGEGPVVAPEPLPAWVHAAAKAEPVPARPLAPSRMQAVADALTPFADKARRTGILVHRLLQYLPDAPPAERPAILARFMAHYEVEPEEREAISSQVLAIIGNPEFAPVFGPGSVAEASIAGIAGGDAPVVIAGRIDRLAVRERDVYIVDYKTGRNVPDSEADIPEAYIRQMDAYRQLVQRIYPDKTVHCALLWTTGPKMIIVPEARFERREERLYLNVS